MRSTQSILREMNSGKLSETTVGELVFPIIEVGRSMNRTLLEMFAHIENHGGTVTWSNMDKGFFSVAYYNVKITGKVYVLRVTVEHLQQFAS